MSKRLKLSRRERFDQFYEGIFKERWPDLKASLLAPKEFVALKNPFFQGESSLQHPWEHYAGSFSLKQFISPSSDEDKLKEFYPLDGASLIPVKALDIREGENILDMCAAPGGKSLAIAFLLQGSGKLVANDLSSPRRRRLKEVFKNYLPSMENIQITGFDATRWGEYQQNTFDKILLDAPCSSERHLLESSKELERWSPKRSKGLAIRQFALLASALESVRPGGVVVYSTCALSPLENDEVIRKLFKKRRGQFEIISLDEFEIGERQEFGLHILPDRWKVGPIYVAKIKKAS